MSIYFSVNSIRGSHSNAKNHHTRSSALNKDISQAGLDTGFSQNGFHLPGE